MKGYAVLGTLLIVGLYCLLFVPAYNACRADGGTFWMCAHWLVR